MSTAVVLPRYEPWPALSYPTFEPTQYLIHRLFQAIGKLKLAEPFQAQWAEVPLWLDVRGLTTGPINYADGFYEVRADLLSNRIEWQTSGGASGRMPLGPMSVAAGVAALLEGLHTSGVDVTINMLPQEVPNPIPFNEDTQVRPYDRESVEAWWQILLSTQRVLRQFEGRFTGKTQPIGLMWGTFDIRLAVYNGKPAKPAPGSDFIRRNAMNAELIEVGWWAGNEAWPRPAFYSFTWPQPPGIEKASVEPAAARWETAMGEFLLDYDDLRKTPDPDAALLAFVDSTYQAGATAADWDPALLGTGRPV